MFLRGAESMQFLVKSMREVGAKDLSQAPHRKMAEGLLSTAQLLVVSLVTARPGPDSFK